MGDERGDEGFVLIAAIVMIFLVLLALSVAAPRVAKEIQRDRELESQHRAQQYVRAIQVYYRKFGHYPGSIEQLEKSNNQRFLRQRYTDPLTGKDDWRLIHVGENKTQVKGFFGEALQGMQGGLGSAAGMASPTTAMTTGSGTTGSFPGEGGGASAGFGGSAGVGGAGASAGGAMGAATGGATGSAMGSATGSSGAGSGISSQSATDAMGTGGPIMGVGSSKSGEAILVVNEQTTYQDWEFLYDPRVEALKAKASLLGGISSGSGTTPGFGTPIGTPTPTTTPGFGTPIGSQTTPTPPPAGPGTAVPHVP